MRLTGWIGGRTGKPAARRRPWPRWLRPALFAALMLAVAGATAGGAWRIWQSGYIARAGALVLEDVLAATVRWGFKVDHVLLEGRHQSARAPIVAALGIARGTPILGVDIELGRQRLEALGWVRRASVARRLPDVIHVRIEERVPVAVWQLDGRLALIDRDGAVILRDHVDRFAHLPLVVGAGAPAHAGALLDRLRDYPAVADLVADAVRVSDRRWNLRLRRGIDVSLPEDDIDAALRRLAGLQHEHALLDRDVIAVDLRLPDRLIVRMAPEAARRARGAGEET